MGNAQIQYNATQKSSNRIVLTPATQIGGAGFGCHVARNAVAMMGIRQFAPYSRDLVSRLTPNVERYGGKEGVAVVADFGASSFAAALSMPFNQAFAWMVCTPTVWNRSVVSRSRTVVQHLAKSYQQQGLRLLVRDVGVRMNYTA